MLQDVHAVAGPAPRTAYLVHTPKAAPSPRTLRRWWARLLSGSPCYLPSRLTLREQHALRLIYIRLQPASACIGSFLSPSQVLP